MRALLLTLGHASLAVGIIGVFLPLLPTTPFVLLASICYSKASPRFQRWLLNHRRLGPVISAWKRHGVIRMPAKIAATATLAITLAFPLLIVDVAWPLQCLTGIVAAACLAFIWTRPSAAPQSATRSSQAAPPPAWSASGACEPMCAGAADSIAG